MAKCPFCDREIDCLRVVRWEDCRAEYSVAVDEAGWLDWKEIDRDVYDTEYQVKCPKCGGVLPLSSYEDIQNFLRGEVLLIRGEDAEIIGGHSALYRGRIYSVDYEERGILCLRAI